MIHLLRLEIKSKCLPDPSLGRRNQRPPEKGIDKQFTETEI